MLEKILDFLRLEEDDNKDMEVIHSELVPKFSLIEIVNEWMKIFYMGIHRVR